MNRRPAGDCIVFDLDGTLVDSAFVCVEILNGMLADRGSVRTIHPAHAKPWLSLGGPRMVAALLAGDCGDPSVEIVEFRRRYAERATPQASLFAGVRDGLADLVTVDRVRKAQNCGSRRSRSNVSHCAAISSRRAGSSRPASDFDSTRALISSESVSAMRSRLSRVKSSFGSVPAGASYQMTYTHSERAL